MSSERRCECPYGWPQNVHQPGCEVALEQRHITGCTRNPCVCGESGYTAPQPAPQGEPEAAEGDRMSTEFTPMQSGQTPGAPQIATKALFVCARCSGTGVTLFLHVQRGVCFECHGTGLSQRQAFLRCCGRVGKHAETCSWAKKAAANA